MCRIGARNIERFGYGAGANEQQTDGVHCENLKSRFNNSYRRASHFNFAQLLE